MSNSAVINLLYTSQHKSNHPSGAVSGRS